MSQPWTHNGPVGGQAMGMVAVSLDARFRKLDAHRRHKDGTATYSRGMMTMHLRTFHIEDPTAWWRYGRPTAWTKDSR